MIEECSRTRRDWLDDKLVAALLWKLPSVVMVAAAFTDVGSTVRAVVWTGSLLVMSGGCFWNAVRCGRLHCYLTGPFFLVMALVSLLHGFGVIPLGDSAWRSIGVITLVGGVGLTYLPERVWGRYAKPAQPHPS